MIIFAIPLRAEETTKDWNSVLARFQTTIQSIFNQTHSEYKCIVACNKIPEMKIQYDARLEFIELTDLPIPQSWLEMSRDKFWKLTMIAVRIRQILESQSNPEAGIYVMPVDGDDLLNNRIAEYCATHPNENGLVSPDGYVWQLGQPFFRIYKDMHTYCGSCNIIKMYREDLPEACPADPSLCHDKETAGLLNARYPIRYDHNTVVQRYEEAGKPFSKLPFRSTVYVLGTGDNISAIFHAANRKDERDRFHPIAFLRSINIFRMKWISKRIRSEFGMDDSL